MLLYLIAMIKIKYTDSLVIPLCCALLPVCNIKTWGKVDVSHCVSPKVMGVHRTSLLVSVLSTRYGGIAPAPPVPSKTHREVDTGQKTQIHTVVRGAWGRPQGLGMRGPPALWGLPPWGLGRPRGLWGHGLGEGGEGLLNISKYYRRWIIKL